MFSLVDLGCSSLRNAQDVNIPIIITSAHVDTYA